MEAALCGAGGLFVAGVGELLGRTGGVPARSGHGAQSGAARDVFFERVSVGQAARVSGGAGRGVVQDGRCARAERGHYGDRFFVAPGRFAVARGLDRRLSARRTRGGVALGCGGCGGAARAGGDPPVAEGGLCAEHRRGTGRAPWSRRPAGAAGRATRTRAARARSGVARGRHRCESVPARPHPWRVGLRPVVAAQCGGGRGGVAAARRCGP